MSKRTFHLFKNANIFKNSLNRYNFSSNVREFNNFNVLDVHKNRNQLAINNKLYYSTISVKKQLKVWKQILTKAEKTVGYGTSFLNLRYLVSDEVANVASIFRKLMSTNHPLIKTAKGLAFNEQDLNAQINGLIVLLVCRAFGMPSTNKNILSNDIADGIHQSQRCLAEITEMINMAAKIHNGVLDLKIINKNQQQDMDYGNKLAILCGDYLLANACTHLAKLKNTQVVDLMSQVIADISRSAFLRDKSENLVKSLINCWYDRLFSSSSSLLANSCKAALLLVDHSTTAQENAWNFSKNFNVAYTIWHELNEYKIDGVLLKPNTLLNAIYYDKYVDLDMSIQQEDNNSNPNGVHKMTFKASDIINDCVYIFKKHFDLSIQYLNQIENERSQTDAIASLREILDVMNTSTSSS